ncbi:hypothetical protein KUW00_05195 [Halomonas sp. DP5N14-9]|uniref:hypothetical protein n=1 Tax=Halomonas sp. DP5N14-9 TaxID=2859075 RepID=UPI001C9930F0|nr:hypothetical protein [Halomonas sp. DP5N14-9]MBY5940283.1 hypothetical protein [Halomonas sp. DP5N14-9]
MSANTEGMNPDAILIIIALIAVVMTLALAWEAWKLSRETLDLFDPERNSEQGDKDES